jgi:molybdate transport system permease protein
VVTGYLLLIGFGRKGPIGEFLEAQFGIILSFRWTGAALAAAVMGFPLMVRAIRLSIEAVDKRLEDAAGTLGASPIFVFLTITLPLSLPGILAGMILAFAKAMGEFGAVSVVSGHIRGATNTMPLQVEILYNEYNFVAAFAVASLLALLALVTLALKSLIEWRVSHATDALTEELNHEH